MGTRAESGDDREAAFREFAGPRAAGLQRSAYLLCGNWHIAEDLVQETLTKAYVQWRRVRGADNPDAYMRHILINETRQRWRRRDAPVSRTAAAGDPPIVDWADEVVRRAELFQALLSLPVRQRATIALRYLDGLSERETAAVRFAKGSSGPGVSRMRLIHLDGGMVAK